MKWAFVPSSQIFLIFNVMLRGNFLLKTVYWLCKASILPEALIYSLVQILNVNVAYTVNLEYFVFNLYILV